MLKALVFDVDGTLADTESAHRAAFNQAFAECGIGWHWDEALYTELLHISGGKERMLHYWKSLDPQLPGPDDKDVRATLDRLHACKTAAYTQAVESGAVALRPGVLALMEQARSAGVLLAIATTTTPANIAALLGRHLGAQWQRCFAAVGDAATAPVKKPHPQVYLQTLSAMHLHSAQALAFEDSFNGLQASCAAGLATVITPTRYTATQDFSAALRVLPDLGHTDLKRLRLWHAEAHASPKERGPCRTSTVPH